jgi:predicted GTPase
MFKKLTKKNIKSALGFSAKPINQKAYISKTTLENNFSRLEAFLKNSHSRAISIIGQPGAGKSSLLLKLTNGYCYPKPVIGQQTDATDWSNNEEAVLAYSYKGINYIDSPGYDTIDHPLKCYQEYFPFDSFDDIMFMLRGKLHKTDEEMFWTIIEKSKRSSTIYLIRGFSEDLSGEERTTIEQEYRLKFHYNRYNTRLVF